MSFIIIGMIAMMFFMFLSSKKARRKQEEMVSNAIEPGNWVMTTSGFYGQVVDQDGDVVILETLDGNETLWAVRAIAAAKEPPFASTMAKVETEEPAGTADPANDDINADSESNPKPEFGALLEDEAQAQEKVSELNQKPVVDENQDSALDDKAVLGDKQDSILAEKREPAKADGPDETSK